MDFNLKSSHVLFGCQSLKSHNFLDFDGVRALKRDSTATNDDESNASTFDVPNRSFDKVLRSFF